MKKLILFTIILSLAATLCLGQKTGGIKGIVMDTTLKRSIAMTSASLLYAKDSILYATGRTDEHGAFEFNYIDTGKYILLLSYAGYADYIERFAIKSNTDPVIDLKQLPLIKKAVLLNEVIIRSRRFSAITLKGDTTEFAADSFKVQPNAKVEDLLRQFPGIQIDRNGRITAQGEIVKSVLVDGEEFFSDDPTLVTKNIRADMVEKVQLYDKTSKQAAFTGVDDGVKNKTINIILKEDKKNGYFGKAEAGVATQGVYEGQAMLNAFSGKEKFALYGIAGNNGLVGLAGNDKSIFGSGDIGGNSGLDNWSGSYSGQGIPTIQTGGLHYDNKWNNDKLAINGNYKMANLTIDGQNNIITQNSIPGAVNVSNLLQTYANHNLLNKADVTIDANPNPNSSFDIAVAASLDHKNTLNNNTQQIANDNNLLLNRSTRSITDAGDAQEFNSSLLWNRKFLKKGRTLSVNVTENYNTNNTQGYLNSLISFYNGHATADSIQVTDQYKTNQNTSLGVNGKAMYTEPLSIRSSINASYGMVVQDNEANIASFNKAANGVYNQPDGLYSSDYVFNQFTSRFGLGYSYIYKKIQLRASADVGETTFSQLNKLSSASALHRDYLNWHPQARFRYAFTTQRYITLSYNAQTVQPNILQIQPIASNNDPLNIYVGNPALNPSFKHTFNLISSNYTPLKDRTILVNSTYNITNAPIIVNIQTDATGRNVYTYSNLVNNSITDMNTYILYAEKIKAWDVRVSSNSGFTTSKVISFINGLMNVTHANVYKVNAGLSKVKVQQYDFSINITASYNSNTTSIEPLFKNNFWVYKLTPDLNLYFNSIQLHTDGEYNYQQKTAAFNQNFNQFIWDVWVGKKVMHDALLVKISGNDILNQNSGLSRIVTNNMITQNNFTTIRRNFMLTAIYDINKTGNKK